MLCVLNLKKWNVINITHILWVLIMMKFDDDDHKLLKFKRVLDTIFLVGPLSNEAKYSRVD